MINIVLCGGSGSRLWPLSRTLMPKQFVKLFDDRSLFQLTVDRNSKFCDEQLIVSNTEQYFLAFNQLTELNKTNYKYLLEPIGRDTAPAIALACLTLDYDEEVLVTPSDHLIKNTVEYEKMLNKALNFISDDNIVTFGITPIFAASEYGYIEADGNDVKYFHEKPNVDDATSYIQSGNYYWNSGIFCFKAGVFLEELKTHSFDIYEASIVAFENSNQKNITQIRYEDMLNIPKMSIDYAVMEKSSRVKIIPTAIDIGWSDMGSFDALFGEFPKNIDGNTYNQQHISINSKNNLIYGDERVIVTVDINDLIVVDTGDALLISKKGSSQKMKSVVEEVKNKKLELHNVHLQVNRPWGWYTVLEDTDGFKIKKITVTPGNRLSLQKHFQRSEHWVVVSGIATVVNDDKTLTVEPNESIFIKVGDNHRLANYGDTDLVVVEVQVGQYTEENDIVRVDDDFNR